jgi:hypothetical protein
MRVDRRSTAPPFFCLSRLPAPPYQPCSHRQTRIVAPPSPGPSQHIFTPPLALPTAPQPSSPRPMAAFVASGAMALSSKSCVAHRPAAAAAVRLPARPAARAMQVVAMAKPTTATEFRCVVSWTWRWAVCSAPHCSLGWRGRRALKCGRPASRAHAVSGRRPGAKSDREACGPAAPLNARRGSTPLSTPPAGPPPPLHELTRPRACLLPAPPPPAAA